MSDFESTLTELLERRASNVAVHPDLDAILGAEPWATVTTSPHAGSRRTITVSIAATLIALLAISALVVTRRSSEPAGTRPAGPSPSNGVIVLDGADGLQAIDPLGERRDVSLPAGSVGRVWAPDGQRIAYSSAAETVLVFDLRSGESTSIGQCGPNGLGVVCSIAWSPDGRTIAAAGPNELRLFAVDSPADHPVATIPISGQADALNWTTHQQLVFRLTSDSGISIESMSIDGSDRRTIAAPNPDAVLFQYESVAVSPDGSTLVWIEGRSDPTDTTRTILQLMSMDVADSTATHLRDLGRCFCNNSPAVTWSPDGSRLALVVVGSGPTEAPQSEGSIGLYTTDPDGSHVDYLAPGFGKPAWQPVP